jgi:solute carrier family 25 (mitochondrial S-adenosylmethionine transporter), member 26
MQMGQSFSLDGLFNGVGSSLLGQIPYGVLTFGGYEIYKKKFTAMFPDLPTLPVYIAAAVAGDMTGSGWLVPSEVVKQNVQGGNYATAGEAASSILKAKGLGGFYQGYVSNCFRDVPFRVFQMVSYEYVKDVMLKAKATRNAKNGVKTTTATLSSGEAALAGAIAGSFSAGITTPLDVMKSKVRCSTASGTISSMAT